MGRLYSKYVNEGMIAVKKILSDKTERIESGTRHDLEKDHFIGHVQTHLA